MLKQIRLIIKRGFKSILSTKLFSALMFLIILVSGITYTTLVSSANSFNKSYNETIQKGNLHDYVLKTNFKISDQVNAKEFKFSDQSGTIDIYDSSTGDLDPEKIYNLSTKSESSKREFVASIDVNSLQGYYNNSYLRNMKNISIIFDVPFKSNLSNWNQITDANDKDIIKNSIIKAFENKSYFIKTDIESNLSTIFIDGILGQKTSTGKNYSDYIESKDTKSISVNFDQEARKVVKYTPGDGVNKMISFGGVGSFTKPIPTPDLLDELDYRIRIKIPGKTIQDFNAETINGYKVNTIDPKVESISVVDPSSYQAIVSPAWANKNGKEPISVKDYFKIVNGSTFDNLISDKGKYVLEKNYLKHIVYVDKLPYFIIGIGTTPDFSYPIIDETNPTVDVNKQAIVFVNQRGYERTRESFAGNWKENYISIKFKNSPTESLKTEIINNIEYLARNGSTNLPKVSFPNNIKLITSASDENDQTMIVQERTIFLEKLNSSVGYLSYITTTALIIFVSSIIVMIFKVLISSKRKVFATMHSLGYSKFKIALSNAISAIVIVIIPTVFAFPIGYFGQFIFATAFEDQWTLPLFEFSFSILSLMMIVILPTLGAFTLIFLITIWEMRYTIPEMLNNSIEKEGVFSRMSHRIKGISIKNKYTIALSLKNIGKLFLLGIATISSLSAILVGLGSVGKANKAYESTIAISKYNFAIDLYTPTQEGGQYETVKRNLIDSPLSAQSKWHIPSANDIQKVDAQKVINSSNILDDVNFLKGRYQTKALLDFEMAGINSWDIASSLMPENQTNIANENASEIEDYINLSKKTKEEAVQEFISNRNMPYTISYKDVIIDESDETYTYIDGNINGKESYKIKGVDPDTKMVSIGSSMEALKNFTDTKNFIPIVIDKYISTRLKLYKGDSFDLNFDNHVDRNKYNFDSSNLSSKKGKVVGIVDAYNNDSIFTLKEHANNILGMDPSGFNGVFTKEEKPTILSTLPLYSPSGLYPATPSYNLSGWDDVLKKVLNEPSLNIDLKSVFDPKLTDAEKYNKFISLYSSAPFVAATSKVSWKQMDAYAFESISKLASAIILVVEVVSMSLSILFIVVVSSLLFKTNKKKIATLWTIGYRKGELSTMLAKIYIIPIIIALAFAIPISIFVLKALKALIINTGQILIPLSVPWWGPIIGIVIIAFVFIGSTMATIFSQKQQDALEAFKGD